MIRFFALATVAATFAGCATQPEIEEVESSISHSYQVVPRKADIAAYPAVSEHVLNVASPFRNFVVIKVSNYPKPKPAPRPIFTAVKPAAKVAPAAPVVPVTQVKPLPAPELKEAVSELTIHFPFDASAIPADSKRQLDAFIESMGPALAEGEIRVEAFADSKGSDAYNQKLTSKRAKEVATYLVSNGAKASKVKAVGMGSSDPVAPNTTEAGRAANRRAELHVITKE